jgi:O-antigen/teichoic acid export membrane protein
VLARLDLWRRALPSAGGAFHRVVWGAAGSLGIKIVNMALVYATTLLLARLLDANGYGAYAFAIAWAQLLIIPALLGMETLGMREVARGATAGTPAVIRGIVWFAGMVGLVSAIVLSGVVDLAVTLLPDWPSLELNAALKLGIWLMPLLALSRVLGACIRGLQRVILSQVPEFLTVPLVLLLALAIAALVGAPITSSAALMLHIAAATMGLASAAIIWRRLWPERLFDTPVDLRVRAWLGSALPFMLIGSANVINLQMDRVMLGSMAGAEEVGIYAIAARNAALVEMFVVAVNIALAPDVAERFAKQDLAQLQKVVTGVARLVFLCSVPAALFMFLFGPFVLGLFGATFVAGESVLGLLILAHLPAAFAGSAGLILSMTGHQNRAVAPVVASSVSNVALNLLLIPRYGMLGAAVATLASSLVWRTLLAYHVVRATGIDPTPLGVFSQTRNPNRNSPPTGPAGPGE